MALENDRLQAAVELFSWAGTAVELAIGDRDDVAAALSREGVSVLATDIEEQILSESVRFVQDDLLNPVLPLYAEADVLYARRLPEELQPAAVRIARHSEAPLYFTTLGFEVPTVRVERVQTAAGIWYRSA